MSAVASSLFVAVVLTAFVVGVWAVVMVGRLLFPERPLPPVLSRREAARRRGEAVPVRARDIVEDLRHEAPRPVFPQAPAVPEGPAPTGTDARARLAADLWMRRN